MAGDRAEHGEYPRNLYAGDPLRYRRTGEGYLLYSVGENLIDDQGEGEGAGVTIFSRHDIVLRQPVE